MNGHHTNNSSKSRLYDSNLGSFNLTEERNAGYEEEVTHHGDEDEEDEEEEITPAELIEKLQEVDFEYFLLLILKSVQSIPVDILYKLEFFYFVLKICHMTFEPRFY